MKKNPRKGGNSWWGIWWKERQLGAACEGEDRDVWFRAKLGQIGPQTGQINTCLFKIRFQFTLALWVSKSHGFNYCSIWGLSDPFSAPNMSSLGEGRKGKNCCEAGLRQEMVGLAPKWVRLAQNGTNPGLFQKRQMHWNLIWKSPGFVPKSDPLWSQTYHPWATITSPDQRC